MNYFVTGGTGFIGRFLVERLLKRRGATVYLLVRKGSEDKYTGLLKRLDASEDKLVAVWGDLTRPGVISAEDKKQLQGKIDHAFHLAAVYDMNMDDETADRVNNEGTRNVVRLVNDLGGEIRLHHVSSIAVAGADFEGTFTEEMFDEGQSLDHPYYRTKFQSEKIVRDEAKVPFRIYRPGMVIGDSETGEMDKIDGPYYFFKAIQAIGDNVPKWVPLFGVEGGRIPVVPVDYVADAMDRIAHLKAKKWDGKAFCLIQSNPPTLKQLLTTFLQAAHGPEVMASFNLQNLPKLISPGLRQAASRLPGIRAAERQLSKLIGVPLSTVGYINNRIEFTDTNTQAALKGSKIECPELKDYADVIWRYWDWHLDYDVSVPRRLLNKVKGKVVLITGASSGIGFATAKKLGAAGAKVMLVARTESKLEEVRQVIEKNGGEAYVYPCDLTDMEDIDRMAAQILEDHKKVDILVNNAGRSIRRSVYESLDRFHDFERTMELNYFGAIRLIMDLLPSMGKRKSGQIINISSIGCLANAPRFSAYVASKAALDAFSRCFSSEVASRNIEVSTIYMPLVRTPMIAPTKMYDYVPTLTPQQAADLIVKAIVDKPKRIKTPLGTTAELSYALWPKLNDYVLNKGFHLFPSSAAAKGKKKEVEEERPSAQAIALANLLRGPHW